MTQSQRDIHNGNYYLELVNPFPGGRTLSRIEIYQYDNYEWFWRDYMDHYMGPYPSRKIAEADARDTYEQGWKRYLEPVPTDPKPMPNLSPTTQAAWDAFNDVAEKVGVFDDYGNALAAFLRVVADEVVPFEIEEIQGCWYEKRNPIRESILAIATELENHP
jgi:hypothetical protein